MKRIIAPPIRIGVGQPVTIKVKATLDGKVVLHREGHSLLANFLRLLYAKMIGGPSDSQDYGATMRAIYPTSDQFQTKVLSATKDDPCRVILDEGEGWSTSGEEARRAAISGAQGMTLLNNDELFLDYIGPSTYDVYTDFVGGTGLDTTLESDYVADSARVIKYDYAPSHGNSGTFSVLGSKILYGIRLGTGSTAVAIDNFHLDRIDMEMEVGDQTVTPPAVDTEAETSTIVFTRTFTNNSPSTVTVTEIGLFANIGHWLTGYPAMIARDIISPSQAIPAGSEFTIEYQIVVALENVTPPYGGVLRQLGELLYRQFNQATREAKDWLNASQSVGPGNLNLRVCFPGGFSTPFYTGNDQPGWPFGPLLGTDDQTDNPLGIDNFGLNSGVDDTLIYYGKGTGPNGIGELRYFPALVEDFTVAGGIASFHIIRPALNVSGSQITAKEAGLVVCGNNTGDLGNSWNDIHFVTRHILSSAVPIDNNELVLIDQEFALQVS